MTSSSLCLYISGADDRSTVLVTTIREYLFSELRISHGSWIPLSSDGKFTIFTLIPAILSDLLPLPPLLMILPNVTNTLSTPSARLFSFNDPSRSLLSSVEYADSQIRETYLHSSPRCPRPKTDVRVERRHYTPRTYTSGFPISC